MMMRWPFGKRREIETLMPQAAYALWADTYAPHPHNALMKIEHDAVISLLPDVRGLTVLDAGCGTGRYLRELTCRGARAVGIDLSTAMLSHARATTTSLARADLRALPFKSATIDVIVCGLALGDIAELELSVIEMARVLKAGGAMVYSVVHPSGASFGWSRTFDAAGRQWAIDSHWHTLDRHRDACAAAGLTIDRWREPALPGSSQPAALVVRARAED